tara:strand:- start:860 stop:1018 length:159 start_codon:yes stop_codon:yes gene_type:complete
LIEPSCPSLEFTEEEEKDSSQLVVETHESEESVVHEKLSEPATLLEKAKRFY